MKRALFERSQLSALLGVALCLLVTCAAARRQTGQVGLNDREVTILVTAHPHNDQSRVLADKLKPEDFSVREDERPQRIISVKRAGEVPPVVAILIQDDLVTGVSNEIRGIREFIAGLPEGSRVMTAYITAGSLRVTQDFTTDRRRAADSLRIPIGSPTASPFSPYIEVLEALKHFDSQPTERRFMLLVSDGLDYSRGFRNANPAICMDLDRAIESAQRRSTAVYAFYAPGVGLGSSNHLAINFGQGSLNKIADETGGDAFFSGSGFVTFSPAFKELKELLGRQWIITYRTPNLDPGYRKIEVKTEYDIELLHPSGYRVRPRDIRP